MKCVILLMCVMAAAAFEFTFEDVVHEEWEDFKLQYHKHYDSKDEDRHRMSIYALNKYKIAKHNELFESGQCSYKLKINKYSDMLEDEFQNQLCGFRRGPGNDQNSTVFRSPTLADFPSELDWRINGAVGAVKDQGVCGACWAFSALNMAKLIIKTGFRSITHDIVFQPQTTLKGKQLVLAQHVQDVKDIKCEDAMSHTIEAQYTTNFSDITPYKTSLNTGALEGQLFLKHKQLIPLSEQNLIDCDRGNNGCSGGWMNSAFQYMKNNGGINSEATYPYQASQSQCRYNPSYSAGTVSGYVSIPSGDEGKLMEAVANIGPIAVAINAPYTFNQYADGVYYDQSCSTNNFNHAVLVVGFGTDPTGGDYWLCKNSWSKSWGIDGYIKMARNRNNHCGIASIASYPTV